MSFIQSGIIGRDISLTKTSTQKARAQANKRANKAAVPRRIAGSGAYDLAPLKKALKQSLKEALPSGGAYLGSMTGIPGGALFGKALGSKLSKLMGSGDYMSNMSANDLVNPKGLLPSSSFAEAPDNVVRLRRREFIGDLSTSAVAGAFVNYTYNLNPGLHATFPFLSQVASNYEEFCFDGLVFEFISSASPYIAGSSLGTVIASMEYNSAAPPFNSKFTMENSALAVSARLDHNLMYGVECAKGSNVQNCYYVREGTSTLPLTTTDLGVFQLAFAPSSGVPTNTVIGELWVTYDVVLKRPYLSGATGLYHRVGGAASATAPIGSVTLTQSNLGQSNWTSTSGTALSFSNAAVGDTFILTYIFRGLIAGVLVYPTITYTGAALTNALADPSAVPVYDGTSGFGTPVNGVSSVNAIWTSTFTTTASTGTITWSTGGTLPTGATTSAEVFIVYVGNSVANSVW